MKRALRPEEEGEKRAIRNENTETAGCRVHVSANKLEAKAEAKRHSFDNSDVGLREQSRESTMSK